ncbi:hypothetical protein [Paenibacillus sp. RUD330]|uniref:hypothetical protein n=1 Tax=Paenibacillus sp. RUD330 TaxID=2023772 RepID=UPI000B92B916|nr:hypothetical protein [Paenibacillus sp. RUD330]ASS66519.1 hypothetical protein CIC07_10400 [Paenibacillus sp. RUD330]
MQNTYSTFQQDDDKVFIWTKLLEDVSFEQAHKNLWRYIRNPANGFPPHPGVLAEKPSQSAVGPHVPNAKETRDMLDAQERQLQSSVGIPDSFRKAVKMLESQRRLPDAGE